MTHTFEIKVVPSAGRSLLTIDKNGFIRCYLKSAPEKGAANKELIKILAKKINISVSAISIIVGLTSRKKIISVETDKTKKEIEDILGVHHQLPIF